MLQNASLQVTLLLFFAVIAQAANPFDDDVFQTPHHKQASNGTDALCPPCVQAQNIMSVPFERVVLVYFLCKLVKLFWDLYPCREPIGSVLEANKPAELRVDLGDGRFPTESEYCNRIPCNMRGITVLRLNYFETHLKAYLDRGNNRLERQFCFPDGK